MTGYKFCMQKVYVFSRQTEKRLRSLSGNTINSGC